VALFAMILTAPRATTAQESLLVIESIEITGNTRTPRETVLRFLPIKPSDQVTADSVLAAVAHLESSQLFSAVEYSTRKGSSRGRIVLELTVKEQGIDVHIGAGYQDLTSWYLIPAELRLDNRLGRGERIRLQARLGYRQSGLVLFFEEPRLGDGEGHWGFSLSGLSSDRVYFLQGSEYRHRVKTGEVEVHGGRKISRHLSWEVGAGIETAEADSFATATTTEQARGVERGDRLEGDDLPGGVIDDLGKRERLIGRAELIWDSRGAGRIAGSAVSGVWGRVRVEGFLSGSQGYPRATLDVRGYQTLLDAALAGRVRAGVTTRKAPFYDRFSVGGLYTVRGFPSQTLSDPGGDEAFWSASLELRAPLVGAPHNPRLSGLLFIDAAQGNSKNRAVSDPVAVGAGYGLRLRLPWIGWLGLDVGIPITDSPVEEAFRGHGSIGWTF
jgi:outer membrane protein assembly factor BamA